MGLMMSEAGRQRLSSEGDSQSEGQGRHDLYKGIAVRAIAAASRVGDDEARGRDVKSEIRRSRRAEKQAR